MHYRHLYYFVRIVEAGSFSRAASTIHVAQPALSQQIAELELKLGTSLLQTQCARRASYRGRSTGKHPRYCVVWSSCRALCAPAEEKPTVPLASACPRRWRPPWEELFLRPARLLFQELR